MCHILRGHVHGEGSKGAIKQPLRVTFKDYPLEDAATPGRHDPIIPGTSANNTTELRL